MLFLPIWGQTLRKTLLSSPNLWMDSKKLGEKTLLLQPRGRKPYFPSPRAENLRVIVGSLAFSADLGTNPTENLAFFPQSVDGLLSKEKKLGACGKENLASPAPGLKTLLPQPQGRKPH